MELLERDRFLANLVSWLDDALKNGGCVALVAGEAGVGKTSLLRQFSQYHRTRVLWGTCDDLFTARPLAPLYDIAEQAQGPLLTALRSAVNREDIFTATLRELQREPAVVVLEDMHWADEATLDLLKYLGRRSSQTRSLIAVTYRDDEVGSRHPLRFVIGDLPSAATRKLSLPPLSEIAVEQLARNTGHAAKQIYEVTGGNPLFVTEVLAAGTMAIPGNIRDIVLARSHRLSAAARDLAELVCVVPGKAEPWLIEHGSPLTDSAIDGCLAVGMRYLEDGSLAYRHELIRRALEDSLTVQRRRLLHAKILAALELRADVPVARLAHHATGANDAESALRYAPLAAAQAAAVGAHREAASHYETALRHASSLPPHQRARLQEQLSYEYYLTDRTDKALEARHAAFSIWKASGERSAEGNALRWLSRLSWFEGRGTDAEQYASAAVTTLESFSPGRELAMAYSNRAQLRMLGNDFASSIDWALRAMQLAHSLVDDEILSHALNNLGAAKILGGDEDGWVDLERSLNIALHGRFQEHVARAYTNLSSIATSHRRYADAARYLFEGITYCENHDLDSWRLYMLACRARARFEQGDLDAAGEDADTVVRHPRTSPISRVTALTVVARLRIRRGDPEVTSPLKEAMALAESTQELQRIGPVAAAWAEYAQCSDDWAHALDYVRSAYCLANQHGECWVKGELAAALWRAGLLDEVPVGVAEPFRLEMSGDWRGAARAWKALACPFEYASLLQRHGSKTEQLEGLAILTRIGASAAAQDLRRQMRARGVRGVPRGARISTRSNPHGLTRREAQILSLIAEGMRNAKIAKRLHVSTRTVDHHVSSILSKLGVQTRFEAIATARAANEVK